MTVAGDFDRTFRRATGYEPYEYQRELGLRAEPPAVIEVPTGSGKTMAVLLPWLCNPAAPRRLVYALPMRSLVEQTAQLAVDALRRLDDDTPVHVLIGGVEPVDWRLDVDHRAVIVGTIDMLLSRAEPRIRREPLCVAVSFGLLNNDRRWVFDEVQLMGPARATSAQLHGLRARLGVIGCCETVWMSATRGRCPRAVASRWEWSEGDELPTLQTPVGDRGPRRLELAEMELGGGGGRSWVTLACGLGDAHGPFALAYLEALVRIADWRASA